MRRSANIRVLFVHHRTDQTDAESGEPHVEIGRDSLDDFSVPSHIRVAKKSANYHRRGWTDPISNSFSPPNDQIGAFSPGNLEATEIFYIEFKRVIEDLQKRNRVEHR